MAKGANQKLKLMYLAQVLEQESDEAHPLTVSDLTSALARQDISAERKSIYDDIAALEDFGLDIITVRGRQNAYYLGERTFQLPEVKLLVDAVQSAKFISENKSRSLIKKICALTSRHEGGLMQRQVHVQGRAKTEDERTYYSVDAIQGAIARNRKITFKYYEWAIDPGARQKFSRRPRHGGAPYEISPWSLLWDDEYYYLLGYDSAAGIIKHYRVDKMAEIATSEALRDGREAFEGLDIAQFTKSIFGMFGGTEADVRLRFSNRLIGVVADRFGSDIFIRADGPEHFIITVKAVVSPQFMSWIFGFGDEVQVLAPASVVAAVRQEIEKITAVYAEVRKEKNAEKIGE